MVVLKKNCFQLNYCHYFVIFQPVAKAYKFTLNILLFFILFVWKYYYQPFESAVPYTHQQPQSYFSKHWFFCTKLNGTNLLHISKIISPLKLNLHFVLLHHHHTCLKNVRPTPSTHPWVITLISLQLNCDILIHTIINICYAW